MSPQVCRNQAPGGASAGIRSMCVWPDQLPALLKPRLGPVSPSVLRGEREASKTCWNCAGSQAVHYRARRGQLPVARDEPWATATRVARSRCRARGSPPAAVSGGRPVFEGRDRPTPIAATGFYHGACGRASCMGSADAQIVGWEGARGWQRYPARPRGYLRAMSDGKKGTLLDSPRVCPMLSYGSIHASYRQYMLSPVSW